MPETTPAAAVAAPAAAPAASAPATPAPAAPVAPAAPAAVPAAPAAPVEPAAAPAAVATPPVVDEDSLIPADPAPPPATPQTDAEKLAAAKALVAAAEAAADPNGGKAWLLTDGVQGEGAKPAWFKNEKYRNVAEQAKAYAELEPRFGSFVGAPKDGKYEFKAPEGVEVAMDHPLMQEFTKWAGAAHLSQEGYSNLLGMLVQYEASQMPNMADVKARLGENADTRISTSSAWVKANLGAEGFADFRAATTGKNADAVFKLVEGLIAKSGQARMPTPGSDVPAAPGQGLDAIRAEHGKRDAQGRLLVDVDPKARARIEKLYQDYYSAQQ